jgi:hypothetical protein
MRGCGIYITMIKRKQELHDRLKAFREMCHGTYGSVAAYYSQPEQIARLAYNSTIIDRPMYRPTEPNRTYDIRLFMESRRHFSWKELSTEKYIEDVEHLLDQLDVLQDKIDDLEFKLENHDDLSFDKGFNDGYDDGYEDAIKNSDIATDAFNRGYIHGKKFKETADAFKSLNRDA